MSANTRNACRRGLAGLLVVAGISGAACSVTQGSDDQENAAGAPASAGTSSSGGTSNGRTTNSGEAGATPADAGEPGMAGAGAAGEGGAGGDPSDDAGAAGMQAGGGSACGQTAPAVPQTGTSVQSATGAPSITEVYVSRIGQNIHLEVDGAGFGTAPTTLPVVYNLAQFKFIDTTQGGWSAGGSGSPVYLQYSSWTDSRIVIDGFGTQYGGQYKMAVGDTVSIVVQSTALAGPTTTWTGTLKSEPPPPLNPGGPTPQVCTATFNEIGQNMQIVVDGAGFGPAPTPLPVVYNLVQFKFTDTTQGAWTAGGSASPVYLQYSSWTDSRIVIDGFGTQYGSTYKVAGDDEVSIFIQNSDGPEFTIWTGKLKEGDRRPTPFNPRVKTVEFGEVGASMHIEITGTGFGTAPTTLPVAYNLPQFKFIDTTQGSWSAGGSGSPVYLKYTSWTDSRIVIDGFGTQYGGQYTAFAEDAVSFMIQNSSGPEFTIWTGTLP